MEIGVPSQHSEDEQESHHELTHKEFAKLIPIHAASAERNYPRNTAKPIAKYANDE